MINEPPPLNRDNNRDPNIKALKRRGFINHGSTLGWSNLLDSLYLSPSGLLKPALDGKSPDRQ